MLLQMKPSRFSAASAAGRQEELEHDVSRGLLAGHPQTSPDSTKHMIAEGLHNNTSRRANAQRKWLRLDSRGSASYFTVRPR